MYLIFSIRKRYTQNYIGFLKLNNLSSVKSIRLFVYLNYRIYNLIYYLDINFRKIME